MSILIDDAVAGVAVELSWKANTYVPAVANVYAGTVTCVQVVPAAIVAFNNSIVCAATEFDKPAVTLSVLAVVVALW